MYVPIATLPRDLLHLLQQAADPLIQQYGAQKAASWMSRVPETIAACGEGLVALQAITGGPYGWVRLVGLQPSQQIVAHVDREPIVARRYHLPLRSNPGCWVFHSGGWQQLQIGRLYEMDPTRPHGAVNWGDTLRVHLLLDVDTTV